MTDNVNKLLGPYLRNRNQDLICVSQLKSLADNEIDAKEERIGAQRIKLKISRGVVRPDKKMVKIIGNKNIKPWMGCVVDSVKYLNYFEALYLIESQCLQVIYEEIPLSIEQSFNLLLHNQNEINIYRVYSTLSRSGFLVKIHNNQLDSSVPTITRKRKLSETSIEPNIYTNFYELSSKIANYKAIYNKRELSLNSTQMKLISQTFNFSEEQNKKMQIIESNNSFQSLMYEIEDMDSPLDIDPILTLYSGNVKPLCDFGSILSDNELFDLMKTSGPKECTNISPNPLNLRNKTDLILNVHKLSTKTVEKTPNYSIIVAKAEDEVPKSKAIMCFEDILNSKNFGFAVFDSNDFAFYSVSRFELNDQYPVLWHKFYF